MQPPPDRTAPTLLVVDDEPDFVSGLCENLKRYGYHTLGASNLTQASEALEKNWVDMVLIDESLGRESGTSFLRKLREANSGLPAILISGHADLDMALAAMRAGATDMVPKESENREIFEAVERNLKETVLMRAARRHRWYAEREAGVAALSGCSTAMQAVVAKIRRFAPADSIVLIEGESGTGKSLIARALHQASPRRHSAMVTQDFGAISQNLIESTLFGYRKGAFTGAIEDRPGLFELASGSTLFLDEIGEATPEVQSRLLHVIEDRVVARLGDPKPRPVDVRLIAATNKDLQQAVEAGDFRGDLYYRLGVLRIQSPPLRERPEDIEPIAIRLLKELGDKLNRRFRGFDRKAVDKMRQYSWPGNARQLRNVIEAAVVECAESEWIQAEDLVFDRPRVGAARLEQALESNYRDAQAEFDRQYFRRLLKRAGGNKSKAAELAGIDRSNLYKHLESAGSTE